MATSSKTLRPHFKHSLWPQSVMRMAPHQASWPSRFRLFFAADDECDSPSYR